MKLKTKILEKGPMVLTGSKILKAIMDNYTPPVDLFVREVIQNSADAILNSKPFGRIKFNIGTFSNSLFCNSIEGLESTIMKFFPNANYDFISISDSNTCGLLGEAIKNENGGPNNLYNLVYDFMNEKDDDTSGTTAGGSCGIGKSVYYRYGNGMCFYYSRTFENGKYTSKLAGALIQNEKKDSCFIGKNSSGIAYFGDIDNNKSIPIYDEILINEFLDIFGLKAYANEETGTIVIIPYFDKNQFLDINNNADDSISRYWLNDVNECLSMAIQRWYFPRINNEKFNGKFLRIAINGIKVELCDFYKKLQDMYNGDLCDSTSFDVTGSGFAVNEILGTLYYKIFDKEELGVYTPPYNLPSPKYFVDSNIDCDKNGLLFYTRKPGMILNYDNNDFGSYDVGEDKYLIGVFKLNDSLNVSGEELGQYMRKTEKSNHIEWSNDNFSDFPVLSKKKPYKKLSATIRNHLNEVFKKTKAISLDETATLLQKKFGDKLMPPLDFGDKPSIPPVPTPPAPVNLKKKKVSISFNGFNLKGLLVYNIDFILAKNEKITFKIDIKAGAKTFSFINWENMDFKFPCDLRLIEIEEFYIDKSKKAFPQIVSIDENFTKRRKKLLNDEVIYKIKGLATDNNVPYGFIISNAMTEPLRIKMNIHIEPLDNKYSIGFNTLIEKEGSNE